MADNLLEWRLIKNQKGWDTFVDKVKKMIKQRGKNGHPTGMEATGFPVLARANYSIKEKWAPLYPELEIFDDLELAAELLTLAFRKEGKHLAILTLEPNQEGSTDLVIRTGDLELSKTGKYDAVVTQEPTKTTTELVIRVSDFELVK